MAPRRTSKAEFRRLTAQLNQPEPPPPALPGDIADYLASYQPRTIDAERWETIKPFVYEVIARYEPRPGTLESVKLRVGALVLYTDWAVELGYACERSVLLDCELIEAFTKNAGLTKNTAANYRSRLNGIVGKVNPAGKGPTASVAIAHRAVKPPYTRRETAAIVRIAKTQPSEITGRQIRACVALGFGAGLDSVDLRPLHRRHIDDLGDEGIRIAVPGPRERTVWVLAEYEDLVRSAIDGLPASALVVGTKQSRRNVAAKIYEQAHILGDAPHFEQSRMRTTWLARLLTGGVPLPVVMQAAGLNSARTLTDLVPLIAVDDAAAPQHLRGER